MFIVAGILHFVIPRTYEAIVPDYLPAKRELVYASGVAEIVGGAGALSSRSRRWASWWNIATLVAVFPANLHMARAPRALPADPRRSSGAAGPAASAGAVHRLGLGRAPLRARRCGAGCAVRRSRAHRTAARYAGSASNTRDVVREPLGRQLIGGEPDAFDAPLVDQQHERRVVDLALHGCIA